MKIRADFVTNSSSVSYIVTMHTETAERFKGLFTDYDKNTESSRIYNMLRQELVQHGETIAAKPNVYYKVFTFHKVKDMTLADRPFAEYDFSAMSDDELLKYIYGEYFFHKKLDSIEGFGIAEMPFKVRKTPAPAPAPA